MLGMNRTLLLGAAAGALLLGGQALAQTDATPPLEARPAAPAVTTPQGTSTDPAMTPDTVGDDRTAMASPQGLQAGIADIDLDDLDDMDVYSAEGAEVGEIDELIRRNGEVFAVLEVDDGWFNWNDQEVLVPLHMFERTEQGLRLPLTEQQAKELREYSRMDGDERINDDQGTVAEVLGIQ